MFASRKTDSAWNRITVCLKQYGNQSSLHGFSFMSSRSSQIFFIISLCCSFILCVYMITTEMFLSRYKITTNIESTSYPIWKVHFPSVTICNYNVVYKANIKKIVDKLRHQEIPEDDVYDLFYNLSSLIVKNQLKNMSAYADVYEVLKLHGYTTNQLMEELAQPCHIMLQQCFWQTTEVPCFKIINFVKTTQGYCCSFNFREMQSGLKNLEDDFYKYVKGAGPAFSLRLLLSVDKNQYASSIKPLYGFKVLVQDGINYPDMDLASTTINVKEEVTISMTPLVFTSSEEIRRLEPFERCCMFQDEGNLNWTSKYSYITCINECKANSIFKVCQCVPFYYPQRGNMRTCTLLDVACLRRNLYNYTALNIPGCYDSNEYPGEQLRARSNFYCACYPQCNETMYKIHVNRAKVTHLEGFENSNISILNVYYSTNGCVKYNRELQITWDYTLAFLGGCFGFCCGGSIISMLECFYFIIKCNIKPKHRSY